MSLGCEVVAIESGELAIFGSEEKLWVGEGDLDFDIQTGRMDTRTRKKRLGL